MAINSIDALLLKKLFLAGASRIEAKKEIINELNVFPVPDGDTGTNMSMTMKSCVQSLKASENLGVYEVIKSVSNDTLRGARGNSGVILSQLMRGMKKAFDGFATSDVKLFADAFKSASDCAYRAVMKPTEGTILTVARVMAECAVEYKNQIDDFVEFFALVTDAGNKALASTPELLPKLKQAGVVDSGGQGLMYIIEGMYHYLDKNAIIELDSEEDETKSSAEAYADEEIVFAYCTECIVDKKVRNKSAFQFKAAIEKIGDSMVFVDDDDLVKVHIHTNNPDFVLSEALKVGSLSSVKIENMRLQHSNILNKAQESSPKKKYAFAAVAIGEGIKASLINLGVDVIIEGGQTMNPSTEDIADAIEKINADNIFVFPNNKNIIMAAEQSKKLSKSNVVVIPTTSVTQSMSAMLAFDEELSADDNKTAMEDAINEVKSASITNAVRDTCVDDIEIKEGDFLVIVDGKIRASVNDISTAVMDSVSKMADDDSSVISVFYGSDIKKDDADKVKASLEDIYDDCDVYVYDGGQPVYHYLISVE